MTQNIDLSAYCASAHSAPPERLGRRYDADQFLPEAGNTIVCHLDHDHPDAQAVLRARRKIQHLPGADRLLFTPVDSIHMTVFEGVIETRRTEDAWPEGLDPTCPVDETTALLAKRMSDFRAPPDFKVRVSGLNPNGLALDGATDRDRKTMLEWREALTVPFGYRHADHAQYRFHMTFAYVTAWLPDDLRKEWETGLAEILSELCAAVPVLPLRRPAFCSFADMTHFEELVVL